MGTRIIMGMYQILVRRQGKLLPSKVDEFQFQESLEASSREGF